MAMTPDQIEEYLKEIARSSGDDKLLFEISKYKGITKSVHYLFLKSEFFLFW